jgi:hypothetical protein
VRVGEGALGERCALGGVAKHPGGGADLAVLVAAGAVLELPEPLAQVDDAGLGLEELAGRVGREKRLEGVPFGLETGVAQRPAQLVRGVAFVFGGEGFGGGGAGVDGPAGAALGGPVPAEVVDGLGRLSATTWTVLAQRARLMET